MMLHDENAVRLRARVTEFLIAGRPTSGAAKMTPKTTNVAVLTTKADTDKVGDVKSSDLTRVSPSGQDTDIAANTVAEPSGRSQRNDTAVAQTTPSAETPVATAGQTTPTGRRTPARSSLPQTASNTPFMLMLAVGLFTVSVALRLARTGWM